MTSTTARLLVGMALVLALAACSTPERVPAVPTDRTTDAVVPGIPHARYHVESQSELFRADAIASVAREQAHLAATGEPLPPARFLAISGGGDNGAFGAGLLVGWSAAGTRPEFKVVTGVSTGALSAPFAFLGEEYDEGLKAVYTTISGKDVLELRGVTAAIFDDAMADNTPLWGLVSRYADQAMLDRIAEEYAKGRLLLIATTDFDARQPVVWNIGEIAASGDPGALKLFHSILIASASIPGAFPPIMIDVEVDGDAYQEMHVDGGTLAQVILYPPSVNVAETAAKFGIVRERELYLIRNARLDPEWASVERQTLGIVGRAITTLLHAQGVGDLYRLYLIAERDAIDYNLAYIPSDFDVEKSEEFDNKYMNALYDRGYRLALDGYPWQKLPPGYDATEEPQTASQ